MHMAAPPPGFEPQLQQVSDASCREVPWWLQCQEHASACTSHQEPQGLRPTKLFVGGISRHTTTKQLRDHFCQFGRVLDCVAMRTPDGHPRGFGYVTLDSLAAAENCLR